MNSRFIPILALLASITLPAYAASDAGETVTKRGSIDDDYYAAGGVVDIDADIQGDAVIAGGELHIGQRIQGDLLAAGGKLRLRGMVDDDARVSGGELNIEADIGDDLAASGGKINVSSDVIIGGDAWMAGGEVEMAGTVNKDLYIGGGKIVLSGTVLGDVELEGGEIEVLESAVINGNLVYKSPREGGVHSGAKISGDIRYEEADWDSSHRGFGLFFALTLIIASFVLFWLFPGFTLSTVDRIKSSPWQSLGLGFLLLVVTPLVVVLLLSIVLGIWVALTMLALYLVALLGGFLIGCFFIGDWLAKLLHRDVGTMTKRMLWVAIAVIVIGIVQWIPVVGGLFTFWLLLTGLGATAMQLRSNYVG